MARWQWSISPACAILMWRRFNISIYFFLSLLSFYKLSTKTTFYYFWIQITHSAPFACFFFNVRCFVVVVFKYFIFFPDVHFKLIVSKLFYFWALFVLLFYFKVYFFPFLLCFSNWIVNVPCGCVIVFINI